MINLVAQCDNHNPLFVNYFHMFTYYSRSHVISYWISQLNWILVMYDMCAVCSVLYCIVLYCIVLYCIVLYCIVLYCIVLYCIVLYCSVQ